MQKNVVFAFDSFKGCLSASEAGRAAAVGLSVEDDFVCVPVSDGGEGFCALLTEACGGVFREARVSGPLGEEVTARYGLIRQGRTAVIEMASASGLTLVPEALRDPLKTTTYGTGELILAALNEGVDEVFIGLGGSATNDGGTGLLQALGYRLVTPYGYVVPGQAVLSHIVDIDDSTKDHRLKDVIFKAFYDVDVPFCGQGGATELFSRQKGAGAELAEALEGWMEGLCAVYARTTGREVRSAPGAGAAGGLGGALQAFLHAEMMPGIETFLDLVGMRLSLDMGFNIVLTGEGKADRQTLAGKAPKGVLDYVRRYDRTGRAKVFLLAGKVEDRALLEAAGFDGVVQVTPEGVADALDPEVAKARLALAVKRLSATLS